MEQSSERPSQALRRLVNGYQVSQAIHVAATLGIADLLADGPRASDDLAAATGAHPQALYRLLRALASVGVFHEEEGRRFSLTPLGDCLRADAPEPVGGWAAFIGRPPHWRAWGDLLHSVRTGENAFRHVHGAAVWDYRAQHPEEGVYFDGAMTANARQSTAAVLAAYDFGRFARVVDVGGGQGALLAAILAHHPGVRGVLLDQPQVVARAEGMLREAGVSARCEVVGGDFFASVPAGGDAYLLREILHDWEEAEAIAILRNCRQAMAPEGRLLAIEAVIGPPNEGAAGKFTDLTMLANPGGRERTREEYAALVGAAGFRLSGVVPTAMEHSVIEAVPA
jgi:O-methyltransferase domain/Dimerisation domain